MKLVMKTLQQFLMKKRIESWKKELRLKESIRLMNTQRSDVEKISLIKEGEKIGINKVMKCNEIINNSLK